MRTKGSGTMMKMTALDGLMVRRQEDPLPVRLHAPKWWRLDRHLAWFATPPERRAVVKIRFLGKDGNIVSHDVRAVVA